MKLGKPSRLRTLKSPEPNSLILESRAIHTLLTLFQPNLSSACRAKLAYISLNTPTACPPRTAVSVNRPFCDRRRCWVTFRHKFDKVCDLPNDVAANRILSSVRSASRISCFYRLKQKVFCLPNLFSKPWKNAYANGRRLAANQSLTRSRKVSSQKSLNSPASKKVPWQTEQASS